MHDLSEAEFDDFLNEGHAFILVDFWAEWCGPCRAVKPILEALSAQYEGRVPFVAINADENRRIMNAFGIRSLPTVVLLEPKPDGGARVVDQAIGAKPAQAYVKMLDRALNPKPSLLKKLFGKT